MTDVTREVDVALIDEYQLISDPLRGWAWTRALLGIPAKEIHLTGTLNILLPSLRFEFKFYLLLLLFILSYDSN